MNQNPIKQRKPRNLKDHEHKTLNKSKNKDRPEILKHSKKPKNEDIHADNHRSRLLKRTHTNPKYSF